MENIVKQLIINQNSHKKTAYHKIIIYDKPFSIKSLKLYQPSRESPTALYHEVER